MTVTSAYRAFQRARDRAFTLAVTRDFAELGRGSTLCLPVRLSGEARISVGAHVYVGAGSWLQVIDDDASDDTGSTAVARPRLVIGDRTSISGGCVLSAAREIVLGEAVLLARNVYVSDHVHAFTDLSRPVLDQGIDRLAPVRIDDGAWLGQNVVVTPGSTIGKGAVIGAGSLVRGDVPDHSLAVGTPARVIRTWAPSGRV